MSNPRRFSEPAATMRLDSDRRTLQVSTEWPVESIVALCETIYADASSDEEIAAALRAVQELLDDIINERLERTRGALINMINAHHKRPAFTGKCVCAACQNALQVLGDEN